MQRKELSCKESLSSCINNEFTNVIVNRYCLRMHGKLVLYRQQEYETVLVSNENDNSVDNQSPSLS